MNNTIYKDIATRTGGSVYVGCVGPVRTGKSTFIKRFMDTLVIPHIENEYKRERATDELPQSAAGGLDYEPTYVYDRQSVRQKRDKKEIGFAAIRGGNIVGEHEVLFVGHDEIVTLTHSARSKEVFAVGAINAALFLVGKPAGLYTMADLVK